MANDDPYRLALRWLARRSLTRREIRERLARRGLSCDPELLDQLEAQGWLSDDRVAGYELEVARRRRVGPRRLRYELERRGLDQARIAATLSALGPEDEAALAWEEATRLRARGHDWERIARRLVRRGFSTSVIIRTRERLGADQGREESPDR